MFHRIAPLTTALLLCALPLTASAQTRHFAVDTADLDLTTEAGRSQLHDRIAEAAGTVCNSYDDLMSEKARVQAHAACIDAARAGAKLKADAMVAAALNGRKMAMGAAAPR